MSKLDSVWDGKHQHIGNILGRSAIGVQRYYNAPGIRCLLDVNCTRRTQCQRRKLAYTFSLNHGGLRCGVWASDQKRRTANAHQPLDARQLPHAVVIVAASLGETAVNDPGLHVEQLLTLQTNVDDCTPQTVRHSYHSFELLLRERMCFVLQYG